MMVVITRYLELKTQADGGIHDITERVQQELESLSIDSGIVTLFCLGSTFSVSTIEYEPGLVQDVTDAMERLAPKDIRYAHHERWHDDNGRSHVKATVMGPSLTLSFVAKKLLLGTWQQVVVLEWDTRPRERKIVLQFLGDYIKITG